MDEARYREAERRLFAWLGVQPTEERVHLPRLDTAVRIQEVGEGPPVLFIHGGPNSGSTWMQMIARMAGFRCLVLDRPGTGLSDAPTTPVGPSTLATFASTLAVDVLDALGLERSHLVVSSFGGLVGLYSAASHPERFDRMVQMACPAMVPIQRTPAFMRVMMTPGLGRVIGTLPPSPRAARAVLRQIGHGASLDAGRIADEFIAWYVDLQRYTDTMANESAMIARMGGPTGFDRSLTIPENVLARVSSPTRFLWGEDDTFGGRATAQWVVQAMPDAELEMLPDAGHLPWLDDPDHAAKFVMAHLAA
jgi:2-hydroxy-6-oxonona-2,4-dienedioate hydrolase